jgi:hypothetical protein
VGVHVDGVEVARLGAVAEAQAAPEAALAAAGDQRRGRAGLGHGSGHAPGDVVAAGAGEPRDALLLRADVDAEERRDARAAGVVRSPCTGRAAPRRHQRLGEGRQPG